MHSVANKLAQYGRGGDDTLVHMNKAEVAGLNALNHALNNRPLSKNPVTGMTEAMDLTDILAGLGIGVAAALTGGAAAAAAPMLLGATAGAAGGAGALGLGALAGAATGAGLNAGKAAIKGDQDIGMAAAFGAGSGALGGLGGAAGVGGEAAAGNVAEKGLESTITNVATPTLNSAAEGFSEVGKSALEEGAKSATENSLQGGIAGLNNQVGSTLTSQAQNAITPSSFAEHLAPTDALNSSSVGLTAQGGSMIPGAAPGASTATAASLNPFEQSFAGLKDTITNPMQHQGMLAAQVGAAGLEDQYKQQGLNEQASAKQANEIVGQYRKAGIMPSELPKGLTDIANRRKSFAAGGTIRDVQGLGAIPTGYINQQPMQNFYPQSMIPQAQPLQSTQPIRHEVIGYAKGGEMKAQKQNENLGKLAEFLSRMRGAGNEYSVPSWVPLAGGTGAGDMMLGKTPEEIENWSYGNAPMQVPEMSNIPQFKRGRAQSFTDAITSLAPGVKATEGLPVGMSVRAPEKVVDLYKLFKFKDKNPEDDYALFVNANKPIPRDEWFPAEAGAFSTKPGTEGKVKSLIGPLAYRPGHHGGDLPIATHIGKGGNNPPQYRPYNHRWSTVQFPDDVDWQKVANERGINKKGVLIPSEAHITDQIPFGGHYRYKTSPNMTGEWLIGGSMKLGKHLSDDEVKAINTASGLGVQDLPRFNEFVAQNRDNPQLLKKVLNYKDSDEEYFRMLKKAKDSELDDYMRLYEQNNGPERMQALDTKFNKFLKTGKAEGGIVGYAEGGQVGYGFAEGGDVGGGDEGLLHGPGTGQSDGIAGLIEGAQSQEPVRLADSEFVIPADVVSALGSGSTKAGAQALYDMLDRIRQQAYGHIQQTNPVDPSKVLPA
jgi:hypothetical protein